MKIKKQDMHDAKVYIWGYGLGIVTGLLIAAVWLG